MITTGERIRLSPRSEATTCPWCHDDFAAERDSAAIRVCDSCRTPTHRDCAALHGGCPILGCHAELIRPACVACEQSLNSPGARVCIACGRDQVEGRSVRYLAIARRFRRAPVGEDPYAVILVHLFKLIMTLLLTFAVVVGVAISLGYSSGAGVSAWIGLGIITGFGLRLRVLLRALRPHRHRVTTVMRDLEEVRRNAEADRTEATHDHDQRRTPAHSSWRGDDLPLVP